MGLTSSSRRRRNDYPYQSPPPPSQLLSSSPPPRSNPPLPSVSGFTPLPPPPPPPLPPSGYVFAPIPSYPPPSCQAAPYPAAPYPAGPHHFYSQYSGNHAPPIRFLGSATGRPNYPYYAPDQGNAWWPSSSGAAAAAAAPNQVPMPYVEHQKATTVKNDVNVHKETIRLEPDDRNPGHYLVSFTFDSLVDGSITVFYFAKEGTRCSFSPIYPDFYNPVRIPFQKGHGQNFCQPSGSGVDLGFFEADDLSKPSNGDVFPLVIYAEACAPTLPAVEERSRSPSTDSRAQITQAVLEKKGDGTLEVKVIRQILWIDGERYELQEIFGLAQTTDAEFDNDESGKDCVICLSEPRDTAVLPCRHMCMCRECAKALRLQSNKCPICRQPVEKLMEIKMKGSELDENR